MSGEPFSCGAGMIALIGLVVISPALAADRHKDVSTQAGSPVRLGNYIHFDGATCKPASTPKIVLRRKPAKGSATILDDVAPLRNARTERGKQCIGKPMPTAVIYYLPSLAASGEETLSYDVVYPGCARCETLKISVTISIGAFGTGVPSTTATPSPTEDE